MLNKTLPAARRALSIALLAGLAFAHGAAGATGAGDAADTTDTTDTGETVDAFARRQLDAQAHGAVSSGSGLELVFTQTEGKARSAYLLVDGRYGKDVRQGDIVKGWTIRAIESDAVEIRRNGRREKLLLGSEVPSHRPTPADNRGRTE
ncbi:MAG: hypothetical protein ACRYGL_12610 [Janthinobacterium lividum]